MLQTVLRWEKQLQQLNLPKADHVTCRNTEKDHYDTKAVCDVALAALELAEQTECNAYLDMKAQLFFQQSVIQINEVWA